MFRVGMKVECIDDSTWEGHGYIKRGGIYTVSAVFERAGRPRI